MIVKGQSGVPRATAGPRTVPAGEKSPTETFLVELFAVVPAPALVAVIPPAWGWGLVRAIDIRRPGPERLVRNFEAVTS